MSGAGYSGTPLPKKLGFKDGQRVLFVALPDSLSELRGAARFAVCHVEERPKASGAGALDVIHAFVRDAATAADLLPRLRKRMASDGAIWMSWPKKSARTAVAAGSDISEDVIRALALKNGLVDVKVCAVDALWSGLKLVIPKALR